MTEGGSASAAGNPSRVGKYRIDGVIGRGASGIVYKGYDEQIDRPLAIKTLRPDLLGDGSENEELLKRFGAEARSAGRCLHPNIVTVFDFVEHDGAPYIVMEYVEAGTLENVVRSGTLLPVRQVGEIMAQLLLALDHAHSKGVVHRDVKPANILCPSAASIKVGDFGVAQIEALNITKPGGLGAIGTPNYMAPERFLGRTADARSDIFSAGVVLYQLLTGSKPFVANDLPDLMRQLMSQGPPSILTCRPELWPTLDAVVQRAMARNPDDRFASAGAFADGLNAAIQSQPSDAAPPLDLTKLADPKPKDGSAAVRDELTHTLAEKLSPATLDSLSKSLARALGPIARLVVRKASQESTDIDALLDSLSKQIANPADVAEFRRQAEETLRRDAGLALAQMEAVISQAEIRETTEALLPVLGPMARVLVARQAATAVGRDDFIRRLADSIPNERDRALFLRRRGRVD
jgi:serine/threonine-protein kinase